MRVSIQKSTGRVIEAQSGGSSSHLHTLLDNATAAGFPLADVEARVVTDAEYAELLKTSPKSDEEKQVAITAKLREIDLQTIRSLREYVAKLPDAPKEVKDREAEAQAERVKKK